MSDGKYLGLQGKRLKEHIAAALLRHGTRTFLITKEDLYQYLDVVEAKDPENPERTTWKYTGLTLSEHLHWLSENSPQNINIWKKRISEDETFVDSHKRCTKSGIFSQNLLPGTSENSDYLISV
jgi:hypothetical protein